MARERRRRILAAILALTGLLVGGVGGYEVWANARPAWEATTGEVQSAEVVREVRPAAGEAREVITWRPAITYSYTVLGETWTNDALHAGVQDATRFYSEPMAEGFVDDYPPGAEVEVYYDPSDPQVSALEVGTGGGWVLVGLGVLLVGGGLVLGARSR